MGLVPPPRAGSALRRRPPVGVGIGRSHASQRHEEDPYAGEQRDDERQPKAPRSTTSAHDDSGTGRNRRAGIRSAYNAAVRHDHSPSTYISPAHGCSIRRHVRGTVRRELQEGQPLLHWLDLQPGEVSPNVTVYQRGRTSGPSPSCRRTTSPACCPPQLGLDPPRRALVTAITELGIRAWAPAPASPGSRRTHRRPEPAPGRPDPAHRPLPCR